MMDNLTSDARIAAVLADKTLSKWLRDALAAALRKDLWTATQEAELLSTLLHDRYAEILARQSVMSNAT
jgi:hypothetical protein